MYIVVELQTNGNTTASLTHTAQERQQAESIYHQVLAAAAVSSVEIHAAVLLTEEGRLVQRESYAHKMEEQEVE